MKFFNYFFNFKPNILHDLYFDKTHCHQPIFSIYSFFYSQKMFQKKNHPHLIPIGHCICKSLFLLSYNTAFLAYYQKFGKPDINTFGITCKLLEFALINNYA